MIESIVAGAAEIAGSEITKSTTDVASKMDFSKPLDFSSENKTGFGTQRDFSENKEVSSTLLEKSDTIDTSKALDYSERQMEKDDIGKIYKENGELLPDTEYIVNGTTYHTDDLGRIKDWKGELKDTPENERDNSAQVESGGKDRKAGDDGGHLQGRQNGGSPGNENLVPMRDTVNRGDYLKTENEENQMLKDGKTVIESGEVSYEEDSSRPSKIHKEYTDGEKTVKADFDNVEGSQDLLETLDGDILKEDLQSLRDEISDMEADGNDVSVTSVKKEYDADGNLKSTTVGYRNETTSEKSYITFSNN